MRRTDFGQLRLDVFGLGDFLLSRQFAAQATETVVDQVGIDHVGFAVIAYIGNLAALPGFPDLAAIHAELAGKTEQFGQIVERCIGAAVIEGQQVKEWNLVKL